MLEDWAQALGWCMALMTVVGIPVFAAIEIWKSYRDPDFEGLTFFEVWRQCLVNSAKHFWYNFIPVTVQLIHGLGCKIKVATIYLNVSYISSVMEWQYSFIFPHACPSVAESGRNCPDLRIIRPAMSHYSMFTAPNKYSA